MIFLVNPVYFSAIFSDFRILFGCFLWLPDYFSDNFWWCCGCFLAFFRLCFGYFLAILWWFFDNFSKHRLCPRFFRLDCVTKNRDFWVEVKSFRALLWSPILRKSNLWLKVKIFEESWRFWRVVAPNASYKPKQFGAKWRF